MGQKLFGVDISGIIHKAMSGGLVPVTLQSSSRGTRTAADPTAGTNPSLSQSTGRGFREEYKDSQIDGTQIARGDWKIVVIGDSISPRVVPKPGDILTLKGKSAAQIVDNGVSTDPAEAAYTCQVRAY